MLGLLEILVAIAVLSLVGYGAANVYLKAKVSEALMAEPHQYDALTTDYTKTLLILGDSTGVGIGADMKEDTVAGLLSAYLGATYVENQAKSGAAVEDLSTQIQHLHLSHYDFILIQIGGNDILAFHDASKTAEKLAEILKTLPDADKVVVMSAGNVGGATLIPWGLRPFYMWATLAYHKEFSKVVETAGHTYINLYAPIFKDPFIKDPQKYLAADGLHPSSAGYKLWFASLQVGI